MSIDKKLYGEYKGQEIYAYTLDNNKGLSAEVLNAGGVIRKLVFNGVDVALAYDDVNDCIVNDENFGGLIGRNSNRIENAEFVLNGKTYKLAKNNGEANLHSGPVGFNNRVWEVKAIDGEEPTLEMFFTSPDGDMGFPGEVNVKVTYKLTKENEFSIHYEATGDQDTIINLTNHAYFNLNGHNSGTIDGHTLQLNSSFYTPNNEGCMPYGVVDAVENTAFDFRNETKFLDVFTSDFAQMKLVGGVDHNFALEGYGFRYCGKLTGDKTNISMEMYTDRPAVQVYTGNFLDEKKVGKDGASYPKHGGVCLETQVFPNFTTHSHYPNGFVKKGEKYDTTTVYKFIK